MAGKEEETVVTLTAAAVVAVVEHEDTQEPKEALVEVNLDLLIRE